MTVENSLAETAALTGRLSFSLCKAELGIENASDSRGALDVPALIMSTRSLPDLEHLH